MITTGRSDIDKIAGIIGSRLSDTTGTGADARTAAMLVRLVAEDYERVVDVLVSDRRQLEVLFSRARTMLDAGSDSCVEPVGSATTGPEEKGPLLKALNARLSDDLDGSLRVSALSRRADEDLRLFSRLQAYLEERPESGAPDVREQLWLQAWQFIDDYTQRRRYEEAS